MERQKYMIDLILEICDTHFDFDNFEVCRDYFKNMINLLRQMNYSGFESPEFKDYRTQLDKLLQENGRS